MYFHGNSKKTRYVKLRGFRDVLQTSCAQHNKDIVLIKVTDQLYFKVGLISESGSVVRDCPSL